MNVNGELLHGFGLHFELSKLAKSRVARKRVLAKENMMRVKSAGFARLAFEHSFENSIVMPFAC